VELGVLGPVLVNMYQELLYQLCIQVLLGGGNSVYK